jgi:hypothetical protein
MIVTTENLLRLSRGWEKGHQPRAYLSYCIASRKADAFPRQFSAATANGSTAFESGGKFKEYSKKECCANRCIWLHRSLPGSRPVVRKRVARTVFLKKWCKMGRCTHFSNFASTAERHRLPKFARN